MSKKGSTSSNMPMGGKMPMSGNTSHMNGMPMSQKEMNNMTKIHHPSTSTKKPE